MKLILILFLLWTPFSHFAYSNPKLQKEDLNPTQNNGKPWESWEKYRKQMIEISEHLGVTCTYCHQPRNYKDSSKREFKIAQQHIQMVEMLKTQFKDSMNNKMDCYLCHRGSPKIEFPKK